MAMARRLLRLSLRLRLLLLLQLQRQWQRRLLSVSVGVASGRHIRCLPEVGFVHPHLPSNDHHNVGQSKWKLFHTHSQLLPLEVFHFSAIEPDRRK